MSKVLVPIANGSEDIETVTIIDVLRRGKIEVTVASVHDSKSVAMAHGCQLEADALLSEVADTMYDAIVLPGGVSGAENLRDSELLTNMLEKHDIEDALLAALCASPAIVLGTHGYLVDKQATCYPGLEDGMTGGEYISDLPVVMDDNILTGKGPSAAMIFALTVLGNIEGYEAAQKVADDLLC